MTNVVQFPERQVRDWQVIETVMRDYFHNNPVSEAFENRLVERMKYFYKTLDPDINFSLDVAFPPIIHSDEASAICAKISEDVGIQIQTKLQAFTNRLCVDRLNVEIQLCRALGL